MWSNAISMPKIERQIQVNYRHQIHFTEGVFLRDNPLLADVLVDGDTSSGPRKMLVIVDKGVADAMPSLCRSIQLYCEAHAGAIELVCDPVVVDGGEGCKNDWELVLSIMSKSDAHHIDRHSYIAAIGGGALLDMVGLAAAISHRGVRHIRIPTTTLSQNDSGVGVKNGINFFGKKNFLGTFTPPFAVINDFQFIQFLPDREKKNGYIEAVKVALIRDRAFFESIEADADQLAEFEPSAMGRLIVRCAELHVGHIATSGDPFEFGSARPLDFGHWAAHKLEQLSDYEIRHGEAVAIGIAIDTLYSTARGYLTGDDCSRVLRLIQKLGFTIYSDHLVESDSGEPGDYTVLRGLEEFREHLGGRLTVTILKGIGMGFEVNEMDVDILRDCIHQLRDLKA